MKLIVVSFVILIVVSVTLVSSQYVHKNLRAPHDFLKHRQTNINKKKTLAVFKNHQIINSSNTYPGKSHYNNPGIIQSRSKQKEVLHQTRSNLHSIRSNPYFQLNTNIENIVRDKRVLPHIRDQIDRAYFTEGNVHRRLFKRSASNSKAVLKLNDKIMRNSEVVRGSLTDMRKSVSDSLSYAFDEEKPSPKAYKYYMKELDTAVTGIEEVIKDSVPQKLSKNNIKRSPPVQGKVHKRSKRLIFGDKADISEYPYVVSIQKDGEHWCTGAILNPRIVITTASCLWKSTTISYMRVRACSTYTDVGGQKAKIKEVLKHPGFNIRANPDNDTALLLLDRDLRFSDSCHAADLPNRYMVPAFSDAWVASFGVERPDGLYTGGRHRTLKVIYSRRIDRKRCNNETLRFGVQLTYNFMCFSQRGKKAPCTRDSGAPAVSDGVIWGLASWGIRRLCGTERYPAMYSYLGSQSNQNFIIAGKTRLMGDLRESPFLDHPQYGHFVVHPLGRPPISHQKTNISFLYYNP